MMAVDALAHDDDIEYDVYYHSDFDSFEPFLPAVEGMIKSFRTAATDSDVNDFSPGGGSTNNLSSLN